jgi:hypothetical protein
MKLRDITNAFESESKAGHVPSADLSSYLILFMASNLARYYPDAWFKISAGIETDLLYYFGEAFRNYELLFQRVLCAFRALTLGSQPSRYLEQDNQIMRSQAGQFSFVADDHLWG